MNERIKELAIQAGFFYEDYKDIWYLEYHNQSCEEEMKKFAELIIKECLMIVYERQVQAPTDDDGYFKVATDMVSTDIKLHFGVEE